MSVPSERDMSIIPEPHPNLSQGLGMMLCADSEAWFHGIIFNAGAFIPSHGLKGFSSLLPPDLG